MVAEKLRSNVTSLTSSIGSSIKDVYNTTGANVTSLSYNIKDKVTFHQRDYDKDDELIDIYKHNIKKSISALKYIRSQNHKLAHAYFPKLLSLHGMIIKQFIEIIGPNSLSFKGIEEYYHDFDIAHASEEIPIIHPKEKAISIESINEQLYNYLSTIESLKFRITTDWDIHDQSMELRISEMGKYLKNALKLIKKRNKKRNEQDITHRKIEKLNKKNIPLDEKDQNELVKLETKYMEIERVFNGYNNRTLSVLPHVVLFLDEFVETITKLLFCQQLSTYKHIMAVLNDFSEFYGMLEGDSYQTIIDQWETASTSTRLQIESFITVIHDRNPELLDQEIDGEDKSSKAHTLWAKMTSRIKEKKHIVKSKDHENGVFNDLLEIDPLDAFAKFQDPKMNINETYHPHKKIDIDDVIVPQVLQNEKSLPKAPPPPLPPRENTTAHAIYNFDKPLPSTPYSPYSTGFYSNTTNNYSNDSLESLLTDDEDEESNSSKSSLSSNSTHPSMFYSNTDNPLDKQLRKIYNSSKNDIRAAPIPDHSQDITPPEQIENTSSITYKLDKFEKFFHKLDINKESTTRTAKYDFHGQEPGDLSFKKGDQIEIIFDFQSVDTLYNQDNLNWLIGISKTENNYRMGFVPNNYFE
ncbi:uncharacterized protein SPAPADRAFT_65992 [Spathaspora passalidarum NRRL Y-27907]|uniref:SH3 domain-containing protein n=1 Tax=Spathaspora passalidarum (strain NRRL Y-27907 / 11-Y1) TaxID=619300 RepID=G3AKS0_SPAPN|nr:uncharacterized protein SPAPADRAFT_65992 [Spathaspora passalidarum NRRL Y-27907]EGW32974.1 hypothetical protein SPAPADRAFT_65992 [Spathaspora passalidarum NRRL Y-27907]